MKYLEDIVSYNHIDYRAINRYREFIQLMKRCNARIIFFNTNMRGNIELGDLVHRRPVKGHSMISMKTLVRSLIERKGKFYIVSHHTHDRVTNFKILKRFDSKPDPIDISDYRPDCSSIVCRSDNTYLKPCKLPLCKCRGKGFAVICYDCGKRGHLCHLGCGRTCARYDTHLLSHYGTCDEVKSLYFGQEPMKDARFKLFIDLKNYSKLRPPRQVD